MPLSRKEFFSKGYHPAVWRSVFTMSQLSEELTHLKHHVSYPASRAQVVAACNNMMDVPSSDRDWFTKNLPEGTYKSANDVVSALLGRL